MRLDLYQYPLRILTVICMLCSPGGAWAQIGSDPIAPDPDRFTIPLDDGLYLGLTGRLRGVSQIEGNGTPISSSEHPESTEAQFDQSGINIRFQPALTWAPGGQYRVLKLAMDLQLNHPFGSDESSLLQADPWRRDQNEAGVVEVTQSYGLILHKRYALLVGLVRPLFGLGMVANPGLDSPSHTVRSTPNGPKHVGDRTLRAQATWIPLDSKKRAATLNDHWPTSEVVPLAISLMSDDVHMDDTARAYDGDIARQFGIGARVQTEHTTGSLAWAYRNQRHGQGGDTNVSTVLAHVDAAWGDRYTLWFEGEAALVQGESTYSQSALRPEPLEVLALGSLLRLGVTHARFELVNEVGYASGDDNAFDREAHNFRFDKNYTVGSLMFRQAARVSTAVSASNIQDPTYRAQPPRGYATIATGGAVENAIYINPRALYRFADWGSVHVAYLYAENVTPWNDPYQSGLNGGTATGPNGLAGVSTIGSEVIAGIDLTYRVARLDLRLRTWAAWYRPGDVLRTVVTKKIGDDVGAWSSLEVIW